jgi:iron complex outermembrane receptor protein
MGNSQALKFGGGILIALELFAAMQNPAIAASAPDETLDEITVTVQRRAQSLQEIGTSVTAFTAEDVKEIGSNDLTSLVGRVPGLQFNEYAPTVTVYNIRGVSQNDYADHLEAPIAIYVDDTYLASMSMANGQMFDVSGIEVARGPQGTLFGRNATGGLIHITTAKPTDTPDGYFTVTGGSYNQRSTEGAIGGPLSDGVRGRISFATNYNNGYVTNRIGPDAGSANNYALRLQLETDIGSNTKFLLNLHGNRDINEHATMYLWSAAYPNAQGLGVLEAPDQNYWGTCPGCDASGYRNPSSKPYNQAYNSPIYYDRTLGGLTGTFTVSLPIGNLVSVTDYSHLIKQYAEDSDVSPNTVYTYVADQIFAQYSEEVRLSRDTASYDWTTGVFYLHIRSDDHARSTYFPGGPTASYTPYVDTTSSWAAYSQFEYRFTPKWSGILGARYSSDRKSEDYRLYVNGALTDRFNADKTFDGVSAKAELDYKPAPGVLMYASYNRGTKGGGFSAPNFPPINPAQIPYDQEVLTDYEGGFKLTLLGGRAHFNANMFYYNYHNYQAFSFFGLVPSIKNQDAIIKGAEFELTAKPLRGLTAEFGLSLLTTELKDVVLPDLTTVANRTMPQAPHQSMNALLRYDHALGQGVASLETDWKHDSGQFFTSLNNPDEYAPPRTYGNFRATYGFPGGHFEVAAFVKNVTGKLYDVYRFDFSSIGVAEHVFAPPRWYGLSFTYKLRGG